MPTARPSGLPRTFTRPTVRLLLRARRALTIAVGLALVRLRRSADAGRALAALVREFRVTIVRLEEKNRYLRDRLGRIPPRHRSHYTPVERFRILVFMQTYGISTHVAADRFLVTETTLCRWLKEAAGVPARQAIGTLIRAVPPVRRYADVVRDLVQAMEAWGFGGSRRIAQTLARAGVRIGRETVRRYRRGPRRLPPAPISGHGPLVARRPNHVWLIDVTHVASLFQLIPFRIVAILDAWSRLPVAARLFTREPRVRDVAVLLRRAVATYGAPRVLISDRAKIFRSKTLRHTVRRFHIQHRFGAVGQPGSIALLERFWRTLKALIDAERPTLFVDRLERRLATALFCYSVHRPHAGLAGATPLERYLGLIPAHAHARPPTRDRPGESTPLTLTLRHLDDEGRFPILERRAA